MNNRPIDYQLQDLLCNPSASNFFESYDIFPIEHNNLYNCNILSQWIYDILFNQASCNVIYTEFKFNALLWERAGVKFSDCLATIDLTIQKAFEQLHIKSGCILCFDRNSSPKDVESIIEITGKLKPRCIVGVDFAGDERRYPDLNNFRDVINYIKKLNLGLTIHAGEFGNPDNIWIAIDEYGASRIGHGIAAIKDINLLDYLVSKDVMLDICITSNIFLRSVNCFRDHPIKLFLERGIPVSINTDNPILLKTDMNMEFELAVTECGLSNNDLYKITMSSIKHSFADKETMNMLLLMLMNKEYN